jgi:hypothetical protein
MKRNLGITTLAVAALLAVTGCSKHDTSAETAAQPPPGVTVFTSFDAQNACDRKTSWAVMNGGQGGYRGQAEWFVPTASGPLNTVDLPLTGRGSVNITLAEDTNGVPGKPVESFPDILNSQFGRDGHLVLESAAHPPLTAGTKYWLCVEPADSDTGCAWSYNNLNMARGFALDRAPGQWSAFSGGPRNGAFRVSVVK